VATYARNGGTFNNCRQRKTEPRPQVTYAKKIGEDRTCSSQDFIIVDRQTHRDMFITILRSPIGCGVIIHSRDPCTRPASLVAWLHPAAAGGGDAAAAAGRRVL